MMLYLIGLGLNDETDLSLRALETLKKCKAVYCEMYTGKWHGSLNRLEDMIGKEIHILSRNKAETVFLIDEAKKGDVAFLIPGDPLTATTHIELIIEAKKQGVVFKVLHASSVYTAVAESGLSLYKFGRATTLVYPEENYDPKSPFLIIKKNKKMGLHTLVLLDIKEDRQMTVNEGIKLLLKHLSVKKGEKIIACCCLGGEAVIKYDLVENLAEDKKLEATPAAILIPGELNFKEEEALKLWE